jgi:hypothetical protein
MKLITTIVVLGVTGVLGGIVTPSLAQDFTFPESWQGVWETTFTEYECGTENVTDQGVDVDSICAGDPFIPEFGDQVDMQCTGNVTDSVANLNCSYSEEVAPGCTVTFSYITEATKSGNTVTGTATASVTYEGDCFIPDMCFYEEFTAVRLVDEDPGCSGTPVTTRSWGVLKDHYR